MHATAGTGRVIARRYRLEEPIGRGAMGTVWRAWDEILGREVAVKELRISDGLPPDERAKAYQRTHREARTAARLSHPGVVTVFDVAEEDGCPWIIMELVAARSLDQIISSDGPLPPHRAADAGRQLLAALATAHAAGVLHRDVKPSNVLLAEGGRAVLTDFGIATFEGDPKLTQTGMVMGSPGFTAPERIQGNPATPASDLWSLGATLYAAVEGHGPFDRAGGAITTMSAIINSDPPSAPSAAGLGMVIDALLRRNPADRPDAATAARMLGAVGPLPAAPGQGNVFKPIRPRRPEPGSQSAPDADSPAVPSPGGPGDSTERPGGPGGQSPGVQAGLTPDAPPATPTAVDLPMQADQTIPVELPEALRSPTGQVTGQPAPGTNDQPADDTFGFSGVTGSVPPAQRDGTAQPWTGAPPGGAGQPRDGAQPGTAGQSWESAQPGSAGQPWGAAPAGSAAQSWGGAQPGSAGQSWGAAPLDAAGRPANAASAWGATPARGAVSVVPASRRPRRAALVWLGVLVLVAAAAAGLLAYRAHHRTSLNTANGSSASGTSPESPVAAVAGTASTGTPPAGYRSYTVSAATLGSTVGFTVAVPDQWKVSTKGTGTFAEAPSGGTFLQIDLTPHTYRNMVVEAHYLATLTQRQGDFPGYRGLGIRAVNIRGGSGAAWEFTWQSPTLGRVRALDLLYIASTPAGAQSFALYMSSPDTTWSSNLGAFDEAARTFRPYP